MNDKQINELQDNTLLLKGLAGIADIYRDYKNTNPVDAELNDAIEYFLTRTNIELANKIKASTDLIK